ncbi:hypothetical protein BaRGS_00033137 [Batillaria attramentaria]|uniref:Uncharacterized protein n=1 Tax=Batillaria attramentaria TaxID=370345 RepID=A0ABD0JLD0_9CAEN
MEERLDKKPAHKQSIVLQRSLDRPATSQQRRPMTVAHLYLSPVALSRSRSHGQQRPQSAIIDDKHNRTQVLGGCSVDDGSIGVGGGTNGGGSDVRGGRERSVSLRHEKDFGHGSDFLRQGGESLRYTGKEFGRMPGSSPPAEVGPRRKSEPVTSSGGDFRRRPEFVRPTEMVFGRTPEYIRPSEADIGRRADFVRPRERDFERSPEYMVRVREGRHMSDLVRPTGKCSRNIPDHKIQGVPYDRTNKAVDVDGKDSLKHWTDRRLRKS